jgi:hypothetical protein
MFSIPSCESDICQDMIRLSISSFSSSSSLESGSSVAEPGTVSKKSENAIKIDWTSVE